MLGEYTKKKPKLTPVKIDLGGGLSIELLEGYKRSPLTYSLVKLATPPNVVIPHKVYNRIKHRWYDPSDKSIREVLAKCHAERLVRDVWDNFTTFEYKQAGVFGGEAYAVFSVSAKEFQARVDLTCAFCGEPRGAHHAGEHCAFAPTVFEAATAKRFKAAFERLTTPLTEEQLVEEFSRDRSSENHRFREHTLGTRNSQVLWRKATLIKRGRSLELRAPPIANYPIRQPMSWEGSYGSAGILAVPVDRDSIALARRLIQLVDKKTLKQLLADPSIPEDKFPSHEPELAIAELPQFTVGPVRPGIVHRRRRK